MWRLLHKLLGRHYALLTTQAYQGAIREQHIKRIYRAPNGEEFFYHEGEMVFAAGTANLHHLTKVSSDGKLSLVEKKASVE